MAAPTDAGCGETVELDKGATGLGLSAEDPIGFDEKNGSEEEEVQVAKKPRVEKAENGLPAADDVDEYGVESVEGGFPEKDDDPELDPLLAHNGSEERINGEGDDEEDSENGGLGAAEDDEPAENNIDAPAVTSGKDAPGDGGLRTLLQEGDTTKTTSLLNGTEDASHMLNGAK